MSGRPPSRGPESRREPPRRGVLFLCVQNSARSQMAEAFARALAPPGTEVWSAGSEPATVNPHAIAAMAEVGIDLSAHRSKGVDAIPLDRVGTVVTLCAEEVCPVLPGDVERLHWPIPDPARAGGGHDAVMRAFREARDAIRGRVETFFEGGARAGRRGPD